MACRVAPGGVDEHGVDLRQQCVQSVLILHHVELIHRHPDRAQIQQRNRGDLVVAIHCGGLEAGFGETRGLESQTATEIGNVPHAEFGQSTGSPAADCGMGGLLDPVAGEQPLRRLTPAGQQPLPQFRLQGGGGPVGGWQI